MPSVMSAAKKLIRTDPIGVIRRTLYRGKLKQVKNGERVHVLDRLLLDRRLCLARDRVRQQRVSQAAYPFQLSLSLFLRFSCALRERSSRRRQLSCGGSLAEKPKV